MLAHCRRAPSRWLMHYSGMTARDLPPPSTLEADAARFRVPVFGFSPQPKLRRVGHGTTSAGNVIEEITISYTFIADPENPDDPDNLVEHVARIDAARLRAEQADASRPGSSKDCRTRAIRC